MSLEWIVFVAGLLLVLLGFGAAGLCRLPLTPAMPCLVLGMIWGRTGLEVSEALLFRAAEATVVVSLFTVGLKLSPQWSEAGWRCSVVLASVAMVLTIAAIALCGTLFLGLSIGAAVLLGAILAPTDPVLASDIQLRHPADKQTLRLALTGEAGLNDGTAFPFVMLGLGLLGLHELGPHGARWWTLDLLWAVAGGLALGALLGTSTAHWLHRISSRRPASPPYDECILLGLVAAAYGGALLIGTYGFLAVFAAGVAVRRSDRSTHRTEYRNESSFEQAVTGERSPWPTARLLRVNERIEHLLEAVTVLLVGAVLARTGFVWNGVWLALLLFVVIRPLSTLPVLLATQLRRRYQAGVAWFGIRGIGSVYYLEYARHEGLPAALADELTGLALTVVAVSVVVHGLSTTLFKHALN